MKAESLQILILELNGGVTSGKTLNFDLSAVVYECNSGPVDTDTHQRRPCSSCTTGHRGHLLQDTDVRERGQFSCLWVEIILASLQYEDNTL